MSERTALYRHFDADGKLLYVGISLSAIGRLAQHRRAARWAGDIASVSVEYFGDRESAAAAEVLAIRCEHPAYNIIHANNDNYLTKKAVVTRVPFSPDDDRVLPSTWRSGTVTVTELPPCPTGDEYVRGSSAAHGVCGYHGTMPSPRYQLTRKDGKPGAMYWLLSDLELAREENFQKRLALLDSVA